MAARLRDRATFMTGPVMGYPIAVTLPFSLSFKSHNIKSSIFILVLYRDSYCSRKGASSVHLLTPSVMKFL